MSKYCALAAVIAAMLFLPVGSAQAADQTIQDAEAVTLARALSDAVRQQDNVAAENLLDTQALFGRITSGINASPQFRAGFAVGFLAQAHVLMDKVVKGANIRDGYRFLRVRHVNGETHVLFRLISSGGGLNYHDWIVEKDNQAHVKLLDVYIALSGETLSQTMRSAYLAGIVASGNAAAGISGTEKDGATKVAALLRIEKDSRDAQYKQLLDDYKTLSKPAREDKSIMLLRLIAAEKLRKQFPDEYTAAMSDYRRLFPGDPSVDLDCIDQLIEARQFDEARQSLDRIDAFFGGDPYLQVIRGTTYKLQGGDDNMLKAKQCYQKAIDEEPTLSKAYWAMVTLTLVTRDYDQTASFLTQIERKLHIKIKDLTKLSAYAGFVQSDAYKKWIAAQPVPATQA
jgi:tetratricopeptide (TPR) repeat protein